MMKRKTIGILLSLALLPVALVVSLDSPSHAARRYLEENGWDSRDVVVLSGHYSVSWLWRSESSLRFRSTANPERGEMYVEVKKTSPFSDWHLSRFNDGL